MKKYFILLFLIIPLLGKSQKNNADILKGYVANLYKEKVISSVGRDSLNAFLDNKLGDTFMKASFLAQSRGISSLPSIDSLQQSKLPVRSVLLLTLGFWEVAKLVSDKIPSERLSERNISAYLGEKMNFETELEMPASMGESGIIGAKIKPLQVADKYIEVAKSLKKAELIDEAVYQDLLKWLNRDDLYFVRDFSFLIYAARQTALYDYYPLLKEKQENLLDSLKNGGLLSEANYKELKNSYQPFELKSRTEIFSKCTHAITLFNDPSAPTYYQTLLDQIKKELLPAFDFKNFEQKKSELPFNTPPSFAAAAGMASLTKAMNSIKPVTTELFFKANNRYYFQENTKVDKLYDDFYEKLTIELGLDDAVAKRLLGIPTFLWGTNQKDVQAINDFLTDNGVNKRLVVIGDSYSPFQNEFVNRHKRVILVVPQDIKENGLYGTLGLSQKLSKANDVTADSYQTCQAILEEMASEQLIKFDSEDEKGKLTAQLRVQANGNDTQVAALAFKQKASQRIDVAELGDELKPNLYKDFIQKLANKSNNQFLPTNLTDDFAEKLALPSNEQRTLLYSFDWNNETYSGEIELTSDTILYLNNNKPSTIYSAVTNKVNEIAEGKNADIYYIFYDENKPLVLPISIAQKQLIEEKYPSILPFENVDYVIDSAATEVIDYAANSNEFNVHELADLLESQGVIEASHVEAIKAAYDGEAVTDGLGTVLSKNPSLVTIKPLDFSGKSRHEYFDALYQEIRKKYFPELNIGPFADAEDGTMDVLAVPINGKTYEFYTSLPVEEITSDYFESYGYTSTLEGIDLWPINLYLQETNSPIRLTFVKDEEDIYIIKANEEQMATLEEVYYLSNPYFIQSKTEEELREIFTNLKQLRAFQLEGSATEEELEITIDDLMRNPVTDTYRILYSLNNTALTSCFYIELYEKSDENLLMLNLENINQVVTDKEITFEKDNFSDVLNQSPYKSRNYTMSLKADNKTYTFTYTLPAVEEGEFEGENPTYVYVPYESLAKFINDTVLKTSPQKLYILVANGEFYYMYLTEEEKESIVENLSIELLLPE